MHHSCKCNIACVYRRSPTPQHPPALKIIREQPPQLPHRLLPPLPPRRHGPRPLRLPRPPPPAHHIPHRPVPPILPVPQPVQHGGHDALRVLRVRRHVAHDHLDADGLIDGVPAVVVGRHADHRVGQLRLARQLRFRQAGHVDAGAAPGAVEEGFGACGELGTFCRWWRLLVGRLEGGLAVV